MYEKLQKLETGNEAIIYDQTNVHSAEGKIYIVSRMFLHLIYYFQLTV